MNDFQVDLGRISLGFFEAEDEAGAVAECVRQMGFDSEAELIANVHKAKRLVASECLVDPITAPYWQLEVCVAGLWRSLGHEYMLPSQGQAIELRHKLIAQGRVESERCRVVEVPA
jgi:hypothetical protein